MEFAIPRLGFAQARRLLLWQGRLRSNEPTQILVCAVIGALIGAFTTGLHRLVDLSHGLIFNISGEHSLSSAIGVDMQRVMIVPAMGEAWILGIGVMVMRRVRPNRRGRPDRGQRALHGGRMSMTEQPAASDRDHLVQHGRRLGRHGGWLQPARRRHPRQDRPVLPALRREDQRMLCRRAGAGARRSLPPSMHPLAGAFYGYELIIGGYSVRALAPVAAASLAAMRSANAALLHPTELFVIGPFPEDPELVLPDVRRARRSRGRLQRAGHAIGHLGRAAAAPPAGNAAMAASQRSAGCWSAAWRLPCRRC